MSLQKNWLLELLRTASNSQVLVLGAGISGQAVAGLLARAGFSVVVADQSFIAENVYVEFQALPIELVEHFEPGSDVARELLASCAFAVCSPGISPKSSLYRFLQDFGISIISELDLGLGLLGMPKVAVTGTNGKTTTVHLINQMLLASGIDIELAGNVGQAFVSLLDPKKLRGILQNNFSADCLNKSLVAEVSSYQLETARFFKPNIGVWLNLDNDHLERHGTMDEYCRCKSRIFAEQNPETDYSLVYVDSSWAKQITELSNGRFFPFGIHDDLESPEGLGCFYNPKKNTIYYSGEDSKREFSLEFSLKKAKLLGVHNKLNLCAAVAASMLAGAAPDAIQATIETFEALEHRLELVGEYQGVRYINDSKATNASSTLVALKAIEAQVVLPQRLILLLGGQSKQGNWEELRAQIISSAQAVILFGADREIILHRLNLKGLELKDSKHKELTVKICLDLEEAVNVAQRIAIPGDTVLLSPAAASFDAYPNFERRGKHYKQLVRTLIAESA